MILNRIVVLAVLALVVCLPRLGHTEPSKRLQEILPRFETYAATAMAEWGTPGMAVAVVEGEELAFARGWGVRELGNSQPVDADTLFQIGSISKSFTTLLVAMEADSGNLAFTDRVIDHLPSFRTSDPWVTREFMLEDLMAQRSGLPTTGGDLQALFGNSRDQIIANIRHVAPATSFRSSFAYQNNFFLVAAQIVEKLTGRPFTKDVAQRLFKPLAMKRTVATSREYLKASNAAAQHQRLNGSVTVLPKDWPYQSVVDVFAPAASISSSVRDMAAYVSLHMNMGVHKGKRLVSEKAMHHLHTPKTVLDHGAFGGRGYYCQGLVLDAFQGRTIIWHNGGTPGGHSVMMFDPDAKVGIVVLSNMQGTLLPEFLGMAFFDMYFDLPFKDKNALAAKARNKGDHNTTQPPKPASSDRAPARQLETYVGSYANQVSGPVRVTLEGGKLMATLGDIPMSHELRHHDGDTFWLPLPLVDENADGFARFEFDPEGASHRLVLDAFTENAIGPFDRVGKQ